MNNLTIVNNQKQMEFQFAAHGETAFLQYRFYKDDIALMHTVVPDELGGRGIGSALADYAFQWAKQHQKKVLVYCPFVAEYVKKHPEYNELITTRD